jgi:hypothetical protein
MLAADHVREACSVAGCDRPVRRTIYCNAHLRRLQTTGDVRADEPIRYRPTAAARDDVSTRILNHAVLDEQTGCLIWTGMLDAAGYGRISWQGRMWQAHRAIWTHQVGPIPAGTAPDGSDWTLDHLCFRRPCVNVAHLEVVSRTENSRRAGGLEQAQKNNVGPRSQHGTAARYRYGCRCDDCRRGHTADTRRRRAAKKGSTL